MTWQAVGNRQSEMKNNVAGTRHLHFTIAYCLLPTAYCLLPTAYYCRLLPTCLPPTPSYPPTRPTRRLRASGG